MTKPGKRVVKAGLTKNKPLSHRREPYESDNGVYIYKKKKSYGRLLTWRTGSAKVLR